MSALPAAPLSADAIGRLAAAALLAELETFPKPGLVSPVDRGSHDDMDQASFRRSIAAIAPCFALLAGAGARGVGMDGLREIGRDAEGAMLVATGGVNTHRGAIFALGLIAAAAGALGAARPAPGQIGALVRARWGEAILAFPAARSHGDEAGRRFGAGGARAEAASGFATARLVGLPALREGRALARGEPETARVHAFFALLARVVDTNLLHRGGASGLAYARDAAAGFLAAGGVGRAGWRARAASIHRDFVRRRLSPGGSADLLAATLLLDALSPE